jgi:hypothetical protein
MKRADIIQNVSIAMSHHEQYNGEIESPDHLDKSEPAKVLLDKEEGKVPESGHPHVAGDHDADSVIDLLGVEVVIPGQ